MFSLSKAAERERRRHGFGVRNIFQRRKEFGACTIILRNSFVFLDIIDQTQSFVGYILSPESGFLTSLPWSSVFSPSALPLLIDWLFSCGRFKAMPVSESTHYSASLPFHSQEWSISNFPCSLTTKYYITQYKELGFRWKMTTLPILTNSLIHFSLKVGRMHFLNLGVKGLNKRAVLYSTCGALWSQLRHYARSDWLFYRPR